MEYRPLHEVESKTATDFWNAHLSQSFPMTERLWEQNTKKNKNLLRHGSMALYEKERIIGFVSVKVVHDPLTADMDQGAGSIQALLVDKEYRHRSIGSKLLAHAEKELFSCHISEIRLGRDVEHYFPGIPVEQTKTTEWFKKKGYIPQSIETDLTKHVSDANFYTLHNNEIEQIEFRVLTEKDLDALISFLRYSFPGRWHYEAELYRRSGGTGRDFMGLFVTGELKGFCRINDGTFPIIPQNIYWAPLLKGKAGGMGPLGISTDIRGSHMGLDLVKAAANELIRRHMDHLVIDWTQLVTFYEKLGFKPWKSYVSMKKINT
ncbi:hypothetical protein BTO30_12030 [Domibacillus antri]|uniref:N-acetyltransferase domain-containing protein n=1 Tax=Domibacillus antri TaxID=1714264 RepID=A0A1Q8Q3M6_9BACI|nr:GNAT family N-acetyltransferase [Domibacillus antri]OLN21927.1 hypothetical protein BTO30_12030 [Domibacillus antri]